jgi:hypothetical protein
MTAKNAAMILGIIFLAVGVLGFLPNPIIANSHDAIFHADTVHSIVHIVSGLLFVITAVAMPAAAGTVLKIFGAVYFLLGVWGMLVIGDEGTTTLMGFLHVNGADNYLHLGLGLIIFLAGMLKPKGRVLNM